MKKLVCLLLCLLLLTPLAATAAESQAVEQFSASFLSAYQLFIGFGDTSAANPNAAQDILPFQPLEGASNETLITTMAQTESRTFACALMIDQRSDTLAGAMCTLLFVSEDPKELASAGGMLLAFFSALYSTDEKLSDLLKATDLYSALELGSKVSEEEGETTTYTDERYSFSATKTDIGWIITAVSNNLKTEE